MKIELHSCDKCEKEIKEPCVEVSMTDGVGAGYRADLCLECASPLLESLGWNYVKTGDNSVFIAGPRELKFG